MPAHEHRRQGGTVATVVYRFSLSTATNNNQTVIFCLACLGGFFQPIQGAAHRAGGRGAPPCYSGLSRRLIRIHAPMGVELVCQDPENRIPAPLLPSVVTLPPSLMDTLLRQRPPILIWRKFRVVRVRREAVVGPMRHRGVQVVRRVPPAFTFYKRDLACGAITNLGDGLVIAARRMQYHHRH